MPIDAGESKARKRKTTRNPDHYYQRNAQDFLDGTRDLSLAARGAYTDIMNLNSAGSLTMTHKMAVSDATGECVVGNDGFFYFINRSVIRSPADGQFNITNNLEAAGVGLDLATDATMKIRTRAQSAYATIDALNYTASGTAGVTTFGPSAVASITVKGGIITAIA